jgi:hypothetical protein
MACKNAIAFNLTGFVVTIVLQDDALFLGKTTGEKDIIWEDYNTRENLWRYLQLVKDLGGATFTPRLGCKIIPKGRQESNKEYIDINKKENESYPSEGQGLGKQTGRRSNKEVEETPLKGKEKSWKGDKTKNSRKSNEEVDSGTEEEEDTNDRK